MKRLGLGVAATVGLLSLACSGRTTEHARDAAPIGELRLQLACGQHSAGYQGYSDFVDGDERCGENILNTFALRLTGADADRYSAVARCGYIRYDNGTFVGDRVAVEARDGTWCHELALEHIDLADRMLLTDVSFAIEPLTKTAPELRLSAQFSTRTQETQPMPAETNLCVYVANRQNGVANCNLAPPSPDCSCPSDPAWADFFWGLRLTLGND